MAPFRFEADHITTSGGVYDEVQTSQVTSIPTLTSPTERFESYFIKYVGNFNLNIINRFWIEHKNVKFVPRDIIRVYKNLDSLVLKNASISEISQDDMRPFPRLREIYLQNNQISSLSANLFELNPNLRIVHIPDNKITNIDGTFNNLKYLYILRLNRNLCIDSSAETYTDVRALVQKAANSCPVYTLRDCLKENMIITTAKDTVANNLKASEEKNSALSASVSNLDKKVKSLEASVAGLTTKGKENEILIQNISKENEDLKSRNQNLLNSVAASYNKSSDLQKQVVIYETRLNISEESRTNLTRDLRNVKLQLKNLEVEHEKSKNVCSNLTADYANLESEKKVLIETIANLNAKVSSKNEEITKLTNDLKISEDLNVNLKKNETVLLARIEELQTSRQGSTNKELRRQLDACKNATNALEKENRILMESNRVLNLNVEDLNKLNEQNKNEIENCCDNCKHQ